MFIIALLVSVIKPETVTDFEKIWSMLSSISFAENLCPILLLLLIEDRVTHELLDRADPREVVRVLLVRIWINAYCSRDGC